MDHRQRFVKIYKREEVDRIPCYFFGMWPETKTKWIQKGHGIEGSNENEGPTLPGMDPDWETGMWDCHGMANMHPIGDIEPKVIEENDEYRKVLSSIGAVTVHSLKSASIPHTEKYALEPTKESWENFIKWWKPDDHARIAQDYADKADVLNSQERLRVFLGGSLYGWLRDYMGIVNISYLMLDNPILYEEMVSHICDVLIQVMGKILKHTKFEMAYIFEDCCGSNGPLFSPEIARRILKPYYKKLVDFYKSSGVDLVLVDSDGISDDFVPIWRDAGVDIIFPIEVGKWNGNISSLRKKYGNEINGFGGVDKYVIGKGKDAIRAHLQALLPEVKRGGYIPIPDHRIPPNISYENMMDYIEIFHEIFG